MSYLQVNQLTKTYRGAKEACVRELSLSAEKGTIVALLGESGCGKTTLLKLISGLERQERGSVYLDGERLDGVSAEKRPVSMVFQKALLFGNMTVAQNVNFAPRVNHAMGKAELVRQTDRLLALIHMEGMGGRKVSALSGGQEQRVSLARALMTKPKLLLLDEPLSALDASLKREMERMIRELNRTLGTTMLYVTHDQAEACAVADVIALMHEGRIVQTGAPEAFYRRPADRYAARFFGWQNFIPAEKRGAEVVCPLGSFSLPGLALRDGGVTLCVRPEAICPVENGRLSGRVLAVSAQGLDTSCLLECGDIRLSALLRSCPPLWEGQSLAFDMDERLIWAVSEN